MMAQEITRILLLSISAPSADFFLKTSIFNLGLEGHEERHQPIAIAPFSN
jgi:hypothetical protein